MRTDAAIALPSGRIGEWEIAAGNGKESSRDGMLGAQRAEQSPGRGILRVSKSGIDGLTPERCRQGLVELRFSRTAVPVAVIVPKPTARQLQIADIADLDADGRLRNRRVAADCSGTGVVGPFFAGEKPIDVAVATDHIGDADLAGRPCAGSY